MLKIYFGDLDNVIHNVDAYFNNQLDYRWLEDDFVKKVVKAVDKSEIISAQCIQSPVLGQIPPTKLSGGTKAVILMKFIKDSIVNASNCGDNCSEWILKLGNEMDVTINLNHIMEFKNTNFKIEIINDNSVVHNMKEYVAKAIEYLN